MKYRYCIGVGVAACGMFALALAAVRAPDITARVGSAGIVFAPEIIEEESPLLLPGTERRVSVALRNDGAVPIAVKEVRVSPDYGSLLVSEGATFPKVVAAGEEVQLGLVVNGRKALNGKLRLRLDAIGATGDQASLATAAVVVRCADRINVEPQVVSLGALRREGGRQISTVRAWHPKNLEAPVSYEAVSDDPAVVVGTRECHVEEGGRIYFCELVIAVDPSKASARFRSDVVLRGGGAETHVPILGWVEN